MSNILGGGLFSPTHLKIETFLANTFFIFKIGLKKKPKPRNGLGFFFMYRKIVFTNFYNPKAAFTCGTKSSFSQVNNSTWRSMRC